VKIKVKTKSKKKSHKVQKSGAPAADQEKKEIEVMSKRIGTIIGQKGATINAIKDATNCQIDIQDRDSASETTVITITGDAEDVKYAAKIINETVKNNYCKLMKGESFKESSIMVPAAFHHTIIGSGGSTIKMLKNIGGGVEIGMPNKATGGERVKLGGDPADIDQAKQAINELMQFTHSSILEPGKVHIEIAVPTEKVSEPPTLRCVCVLARALIISLSLPLLLLLPTSARAHHWPEGPDGEAHPGIYRHRRPYTGPPPWRSWQQERRHHRDQVTGRSGKAAH